MKGRQTVVCRASGSDDAVKEGSSLGIDSEGLDLDRELNGEVDNREEEIEESEPRKGNPVPLMREEGEAALYYLVRNDQHTTS